MFTQPDEENVTVALGYATPNPSADAAGTFILNFTGPDPRAYFPSTYSYILSQTAGFDAAQGAVLGRFLCYAISAGQSDAVPLRYARLSKPIVDIAIEAISHIPGAPDTNHCYVAGAAPPPPPPAVERWGRVRDPGSIRVVNRRRIPIAAQSGGPVGNGTGHDDDNGEESEVDGDDGRRQHGRDPGGTTTDSSIAQENIDLKIASAADHAG